MLIDLHSMLFTEDGGVPATAIPRDPEKTPMQSIVKTSNDELHGGLEFLRLRTASVGSVKLFIWRTL